MGALEMGVPEEELQSLVDDWRRANPEDYPVLKDVQTAAHKAVRQRSTIRMGRPGLQVSQRIPTNSVALWIHLFYARLSRKAWRLWRQADL